MDVTKCKFDNGSYRIMKINWQWSFRMFMLHQSLVWIAWYSKIVSNNVKSHHIFLIITDNTQTGIPCKNTSGEKPAPCNIHALSQAISMLNAKNAAVAYLFVTPSSFISLALTTYMLLLTLQTCTVLKPFENVYLFYIFVYKLP